MKVQNQRARKWVEEEGLEVVGRGKVSVEALVEAKVGEILIEAKLGLLRVYQLRTQSMRLMSKEKKRTTRSTVVSPQH
jgi:hypothetical protein